MEKTKFWYWHKRNTMRCAVVITFLWVVMVYSPNFKTENA